MFVIHKTGNKTGIQPILKSNSTSFMFNNIFLWDEYWKSYPLGGAQGNAGTMLISSLKCNFSIYLDIQVYYLDIQAITTLLCLLLVLYVLVPSIHTYFYRTTALLKSNIFWHSKAYTSQFSTYRQQTGFIV